MKTLFNEKFYDINEIAEMLGFTLFSTRKLLRDEKIKGCKIGKSWYATKEAIMDYVKRKK